MKRYRREREPRSIPRLFSTPDDVAPTDKLTITGGGDWAGANSWTFSAWVKPVKLGNTHLTVFPGSGVSGSYTLYSQFRDSGYINTYYHDDSKNSYSTGAAWGGATNEWFRLTVVFNAENGTVTTYRDSKDDAGGLTVLKTSSNYYTPMTLNSFQLGFISSNYGFQGYMDDVRIYDTALTESEVDEISGKTLSLMVISTPSD